MTTRDDLAEVWRQAAQVSRQDIFGPQDPLRPEYQNKSSALVWQIDVPSVGMVGSGYRNTLAILSVNGAGGKDNAESLPSSDEMYKAFLNMKSAAPGVGARTAFEAVNSAVIASIPDWGITKRHVQKVLDAAQVPLEAIAFLYLVPFRVRGDGGAAMKKIYLEAGYDRHLVWQLRAVTPDVIIALDRPSERAARKFQEEFPKTDVIYYTGKRDAHAERAQTLLHISSLFRRKNP